MKFKNIANVSGFLVDLKYTNSGSLVGTIKQDYVNERNETFTWYFNFVYNHVTVELLKQLSEVYQIQQLQKGIDITFNSAYNFEQNDRYLLDLSGTITFYHSDLQLVYDWFNKYQISRNEIEQFKTIFSKNYENIYLDVAENRFKIAKVKSF